MHVHFRRFQLVVPQQLFYDFQVRALLDQMRGERVSQQVGVHPLGDSGFLRRLFQLLRHDALRERLALVPLEQPFLRLVQLGVLGQLPDKGLRQQRVAVFPPLPCRTRISERLTLISWGFKSSSSLILNPAE